MKKIVAITGANRGLGLGLAESLIKNGSNYHIILCCRDQTAGRTVLNKLVNENTHMAGDIQFANLDVADPESHDSFQTFIEREYGEIDALVNNAGILHKDTTKATFRQNFDETDKVNYTGLRNLTEQTLNSGLISKGGQIINLGSRLANSAGISDKEYKHFIDTARDIESLDDAYYKFQSLFSEGYELPDDFFKKTFPFPEYSFLKILLHRWGYILAHTPEIIDKEIRINSVCPGWVKTELGGKEASLEIEEGVDTLRWLLDHGEKDGAPGEFNQDWIENWQGELIGNRKVVKGRAGPKKMKASAQN